MKVQTGVANLLNEVIASADGLANLACRVFDRLPLEEQPRYLAALGCGDGFFLRAMFEAIRRQSRRGQALENYPLRLIGIDTDEKALQTAAQHLADLPHLLIRAGSEDPQHLLSELDHHGIHDPENILYLRTFPSRTEDLGKLKTIVSEHGVIQLDVHSPGDQTVPERDHRNASKHFDPSGEQLSEASVLLMRAAGAGLFPERAAGRRWPGALGSTQVTLNRFVPRPYTVRHPTVADIGRLRDLELAAWSENLGASDSELRRRVELVPNGQAVLENEGRLVAALYSQRITSVDQLFQVNYAALAQLHDPKGRVAQLLGICVHPELRGRGFADELIDFMLVYFAACEGIENLVGVTRCHHYWRQRESGASHEDYVRSRNEHGRLSEPMLQFHEAHGAVIRAVLPLFRPDDVQNTGAGVLIEYQLQGDLSLIEKGRRHQGEVQEDISAVVRESIQQVLGSARIDRYELETPLMEMGLSSLQLLELRHLLQERTAKELEPTCFFKWGTPAAIIGHLSGDADLKRVPESPPSLEHRESMVAEVASGSSSQGEPIAIVGLGCHFPGDARGPNDFWTLLRNEQSAIAERPLSREQIVDPAKSEASDLSFAERGGFLDRIDQFDAGFFRISPREADLLDPQHRLLLEIVWESLEDAGLAPLSLRGSSTGVFVGMMGRDYEAQIASRGTVEDLSAYFSTGNAPSVAAGRLAYFFDWRGPALTVDTACSSSLVAVHLACQSLHSGECNLAVAAGVNLLMDGKSYLAFGRAGMLASDGRCKTFDAAADGYVRSEGCGTVVLKRLSEAKRDRDRILAVIRGSAVNQDGASSGLTVPNQISQQEVIERAVRNARVAPREVVYLEAHGTGTSLGDPIEVEAAAAVLGQGRGTDRPLLIGSVKTNIGHLEAAAGMAGLIKVILAMEHGVIPKHLHFQKPNPHIAWERLPVKVTSEATAWPDGRKIAGVSSFGFSGTNAHVIVEEAPAEPRIEQRESERSEHLLVLSARSEVALQQLAGRYVQWLEANPKAELAGVCYSAGVGRSHLGQRAAVVVKSVQEARDLLVKLERGESGERWHRGQGSKRPKVAWLFTGQGSQYVGMGRELYRNQPVVREVLDRCQELLRREGERPLLEVLFEQEDWLNQTRYTQPALLALEVALAELWRSWGQEPDIVLGHSVGQYAAAVVAGIFSLEEGLRLVAKRGELMGQLPAGGGMAAVFSDLAGLEEVLAQEVDLSLAADNGGHLVLSGAEEVLERVLSDLRKAGVRSQRLNTSHGFHSKLMEPVLEEFESSARGVKFGTAKVGVVCNLTGNLLGAAEAAEPSYWRRHLRETVQFSRSIRTVAELGIELMLEVGPQPILLEMAQNCWPPSRPMALKVASMRRGQGETRQIAEAAAQLYVRGLTPDFTGWDRPWLRRKLSLPTYPFQRSRFWINANRLAGKDDSANPVSTLPTAKIQELLYETSWESSKGLVSASDWVPGCWLLLADRQGWASRIKTFLERSKQKCQLFYYDEFVSQNKLEEVLLQLEKSDLPLRQVVHLWSLDLPSESQTAGIVERQRLASISTLQVVQVLARRPRSVPFHLITRGACAVKAGDPVEPFQAPWWGFGKVIGLELPKLRGALVDLPAAAEVDPDLVGALSRALVDDQEEDYVALRSGGRYVLRLKRGEQSVAAPMQLSSEASYLITGGLGALGMKTASWLVERGAQNLVLVGRRGPSESALSTIQRLRTDFGCRVEVWQDDISQAEGVKRIVGKISAVMPPLRGVVHAAGAIGKTPLTELLPDQLTGILAPKVQGAWWLHQFTRSLDLDFFVTFSSVSSVWGSVGQAHYAAGNAFMDALMWSRRAQGLPGTSLNFGPWDDGGMAEGELLGWLDANGIKPLNPSDALNGWQAVHNRGQTIIANVDWARFGSIYQARRRRPLFDHLVPEAGRTDTAGEKASPGGHGAHRGNGRDFGERIGESAFLVGQNGSPLVGELEDTPAAQRRSILEEHVRRAVGQVLRMNPTEIDAQLGLFDLGMDSMTAVEFRQLLEQKLGCSLPATLAMDRPRVSEVVEYLLAEVLAFDSAKKVEPATVHFSSPNESIAVIGLACRVPGAEGPEEFWHLLQTESDAIAEIPSRRWDVEAYYDPDPEAPGKIYTRYAGLLDQVDQFDASLFGIAPREAASMDPQQRIVLEVAWEALERAGIAPQVLGQTRTGVYLGASATEYAQLIAAAGPEAIDAHFGTGTALNAIAGRLAFSLGLEGPALLIDTACSSSLVALHQACQALRSGECDLSLAGGVNLLLGPEGMIATCRARMLSSDGRCKTFDAAADGYVRSEGCGVVVLKRLSDARRDRDRILAVIRGSAVNQDGASSSLTVPKGPAQERVIRDALRQAGIDPQEVVYLEAHGTGTSLGDPIEVQAAAAVLGEGRGTDRPLLIGSVKTNIGHLEAAAGMAGLIKVILAMEHGVIPKHLHFQKPNPHIAWERLPVKVTSEATAWPDGRKIAGVSSFGFSGTNAHVIVEEAPAEPRIEQRESERSEHLLVLSARSEVALQQLAGRYVQWLEANPKGELADVCYSAGVGRSHLGQRAAVVVKSFQEARDLLVKLERGESGERWQRGQGSKRPKVAWLFTGQGSQYVGMGRELYRNQPVVREILDRCQELLRREGERPLLEVLFEQEDWLNQTRYTQPALLALEVALAELWRSWGQEPDIVLGHSVGQYAAAVVAGIFSLEEGLRLVAKRGELMGQLPAGGGMAAVFSDLAGLEEVLAQEVDLSLAADNGGHLVLSGAEEVLERVLSDLRKAGVRSQRLNTSHGFHSKLMEPMLEEFESSARGVKFGTAKVGVVCNLTGNLLGAAEAAEPSYWRRHLRETVQFSRSIRTVAELGIELMLEVGPQPILLEIAQSCWPPSRPMALKVASMRRGQGETRQIAEAAAQLYVRGLTPDFTGWDRPWLRRKLSLPTYPFQRSRFWIKPRSERQSSAHGTSSQLLGTRNELASGEVVHRSEFGYLKHPWLIDHQLYQTVVVPGPAYVAMTFSAAGMPAEIRDVAFHEPLLLRDATGRDFQLLFSAPTELGERSFQYHSRPRPADSAPWTRHASGVVRPLKPAAKPSPSSTPSIEELQKRMEPWSVDQLYGYFGQRELQLGPTFRSIRAIWRGSAEALGELVFAEPLIPFLNQEPIHPAVMDSCMHVVGAVPYDGSDSAEDIFYAPLHFERVTLYQPVPSRFFCYATAARGFAARAETRVYDLNFITPAGDLIGRVDAFTMKRASRQAFLRSVPSAKDELLYRVEWREHPAAEAWNQPASGRWLIVTRDHAIGSHLVRKLRQRHQKGVLAIPGGVFRQLSDESYEIPFEDEPEWERFLSEQGRTNEPLDGIIHICCLDTATVEPMSARVIEREVHFNCGTLLAVLQTLIRGNRRPNRGLWIVTNEAQATETATPQSVIQSTLWGLGRVLQSEHPDLSCRLIDLDQPLTEAALEQLIHELDRDTAETQVVLRKGHAVVPRLVRIAPEQRKAVSFRHDATYLVTGGLGGIGLELARWLVQRGVRTLALNGRSAPSQEALPVIAELRTLGARVELFQADVSKEEEVNDCLTHILRWLPPLRGVFHLAGVARDGALASQTWPQFGEVIAPKVQGAWNLHRLTLDQPVDWFVLFSSAAVLLGNPGQANYAAANAYLDALAHYRRRALGLSALSILWGPWSEVGLAARRADELSQRFHRTGLDWMNPQRALEALEDAMSRKDPGVGVMAIDWSTFASQGGRKKVSPLFAELVDWPAKNETVLSTSERSSRVQDARSEKRLSVLIDLVGQEVQQVLQTEQPPNPDAEFSTLGMDSLMAIELRNRLQRQMEGESSLPYALTFQYPNVKAVAEFLFQQLQSDQESSPETVASTPLSDGHADGPPAPQIGHLSTAQPADKMALPVERVNPSRTPRRSAAFEPVAVIGISGRFPGAPDLQSYWQNLAEGKSSITKFPRERSAIEKSQTADLQLSDEKNLDEPWGGFLDGVDEFDAPFFKMARAEAEQLDPQHRLFLQEAWKALEDAGYSMRELKGGSCGIFVGTGASEYYAQISEPDAHTLTGNIGSGLTGRLAYLLDWTGPCLALDTACASSFSAIHLACASLARGECDLALAGGVHVATSTKVFTSMTQMGLLSPSGRSRTFDAAADGWVLSEGVGAAILKRMEDAERDGDHIYGVLRGCGTNQDGAKSGLTAPKATAQTALQLRVYREAGIDPASIDYMEVHGLSSLLGDEIELFALKQSFASFTKEKGFCALGTLKPNIGHPFFAAGIASLIKVLLALKHGQIPPLIAPENVNEGLGLEASPFYLNTELTEWKRRSGRPRRAAVNGLSAIGTNCHLVVEEHVTELTTAGDASVRPALLFPLSARNELSLRESASNFLQFLEDDPNVSLVDAAFTLQVGREAMEERLAFAAYSLQEAKGKLSGYLKEGRHAEVYRHRTEQIDPATGLLVSGEEGRQFLATAIRNRSLDKLALLWTKGIEIDWRLLYEDIRPRRISLPTYSFARTRYWHPHPRTSDPVSPSQNGSRNERSDLRNGGVSELAVVNSDNSPRSAAPGQMTDLLRGIIAEVLRCSSEEIDPDRDLSIYGFDSLYVLRVVDQFKARTNLQLTPRIFFGCRTIRELVRKIGEQPSSDSLSPRSEKVFPPGSNNGDHFTNGDSNGERRTVNREREVGNSLGRFRVSEGQKALWSIQQSHPTDPAYNLPIAVFWNEPIDFATLQVVLEQIAEEQPALRTSIVFEGTELVQRVQGSVPVVVHQKDLGQFSEAEVVHHLNELNKVPFNLARAPLWRAHAFSSAGGRSILLLNFHHLIFDGYSAGFLLEEIERRYRSIRAGIRSERRVPQRGLADYITIERNYLASEAFGHDRTYWLSQFPTGLPGNYISKDGVDKEMGYRAGAVVQMPIGESLISALKNFAAVERVTLQAVCLAAFQMVLAMDSATEEVAAGVAVNVRPPEGFDEVIGFFVNILPIRAMVPGALPFRDFLQQIFNRLLEALEHRGFPFRQLVQAWTENYGTANELAAAFYFQTWSSAEQRRLADRFVPNIHQSGEFNLVFEVMEAPADWRLSVKYRPASYSRARVEHLAAKFTGLLASIAKNPENSLSRMLEKNRSSTESEWFDYPRHRCVQELIEDQVAQRAEEVAVIFRDQRLTYRELNNRANQLSHFLIRSGVQPGMLVGVMLERSLEMLIGLLAVWKAGGAYIPLDPTHPAERLEYILGDARAEWLLTNSACRFRTDKIRVIKVDAEEVLIRRQPIAKPVVVSGADSLAYVIYTSGSTGDPKGVQITQRNLTHFLWSVAQRPGCTSEDYLLAGTTICFDIAALELFLPLITGAEVEILSEEVVKNGLRLKEKIEGSPVTLFQATPATWKMLLAAELGRIPRVKALCGGEAWDLQLADQLLMRTCELWNMYGPTETTIWSSIQKVGPGQPICLGDPIGNTQFYVFDEAMQPVRSGEIGELFIGGDGLAKGYLNRPELTRERFVPNPLRPEELIYRTGDLVRYV